MMFFVNYYFMRIRDCLEMADFVEINRISILKKDIIFCFLSTATFMENTKLKKEVRNSFICATEGLPEGAGEEAFTPGRKAQEAGVLFQLLVNPDDSVAAAPAAPLARSLHLVHMRRGQNGEPKPPLCLRHGAAAAETHILV